MICVELAVGYFGLGLTKIDSLLTKICVKNDFTLFPSDLDQLTFRQFAPLSGAMAAMFPLN